jgi:hypothetical protein
MAGVKSVPWVSLAEQVTVGVANSKTIDSKGSRARPEILINKTGPTRRELAVSVRVKRVSVDRPGRSLAPLPMWERWAFSTWLPEHDTGRRVAILSEERAFRLFTSNPFTEPGVIRLPRRRLMFRPKINCKPAAKSLVFTICVSAQRSTPLIRDVIVTYHDGDGSWDAVMP